MKQRGWGVYLLPRTDEHQSQYLCETDQRVAFASGFTGSNAFALISQSEAYVWTDGRYYLQAEKQLYPGWKLMKSEDPRWIDYLIKNVPSPTKVALDPRLFSAQLGEQRVKKLVQSGYEVQQSFDNIVDRIWKTRPQLQHGEIFIHEQWAGRNVQEKVGWVRAKMSDKQGNSAIFNDLSEIAWLLNLRSSQIPYNPFFKSVLCILPEGGILYLPQTNVLANKQVVENHLKRVNIIIRSYQPEFGQKALITKDTLNLALYNLIKDKDPITWEGISLYRCVRNQKEIAGFRRSHLVDGLAMAQFWAWRSQKDEVDQYEAALYINNLRLKQQLNKGLSFATISAGGPNAAIIHYHPTQTNHSLITKDMVHLLDSGGQYLDGTTDVTRTFNFGKPTQEQKDAYTRVLLGNLDIERLRWPKGKLNGDQIDVLARRHLWKKELDYCHGTGHGVGHFEGVHEGPVGISFRCKTVFQTGMIVTNQPGYYQKGKFGIRIQNQLLVGQENGWNKFENLTLCPYDRNLIEKSLLENKDFEFINQYHKRCWQSLSPKLEQYPEALKWLKEYTEPL